MDLDKENGYFHCEKLNANIRPATCAKMHLTGGYRHDAVGNSIWSPQLATCAKCEIGAKNANGGKAPVPPPVSPDPVQAPLTRHARRIGAPTGSHCRSAGANREWLQIAKAQGFSTEKEMWECLVSDCYTITRWATEFGITMPALKHRLVLCGIDITKMHPRGGARKRVIHDIKVKCSHCGEWHEISYYVRKRGVTVIPDLSTRRVPLV